MGDDLADRPTRPEALPAEVPHLRFLKVLVAGLAGVMALGITAIVALLWLRLGTAPPPLPQRLTLPPGEAAAAVTQAEGRTIVVTRSGRVLVYDPAGALRQEVVLTD